MTGIQGVQDRAIRLPVGGCSMPVDDMEPAVPARRAVVVLHDAAGAGAHHADVTRRFAQSGYRAVAPHLYHRTGDPKLDYADVTGMVQHLSVLTEEQLLDDLDAVLTFLSDAGLGDRSVGVVGFCMGGSIGFLAAVRRRLGAAVTFYGGNITKSGFGIPPLLDVASELRTPWLGLYGDLDPSAPVAEVEQLRAGAGRSTVPTEICRYPEAGHAFHCDIRPDTYHEQSAADAWQRTIAWLDRFLPAAPATSPSG